MGEDKEIIHDHYEVVSSMRIGSKHMILAVSTEKDEPHPYLKCIYTENELFGRYDSAIASDSYTEIIKLYADDIKAEAIELELLCERWERLRSLAISRTKCDRYTLRIT